MKCPQCGAELNARARFCDVCGAPVMNVQQNAYNDNRMYQQSDNRAYQTDNRSNHVNNSYDGNQPPKKGNKTKVILISLIAFLLVAAIALSIALILKNNVSQAELDEAKQKFVPPAEAFEIDTTLDDPSNEKVKFTFDSESRISTCTYQVNNKDYQLKYYYDNVKELVRIDVNYRDHVIDTAQIEYSRVLRPDRFVPIDGYYLRLGRPYVKESPADAADETDAQSEPAAEIATRGFGIGRVISNTDAQTEAPATEAATEASGSQHAPQAIPEVPDDLTAFVDRYGIFCAKDYDCRHAVENDQNILSYIVNLHSCVQIMSEGVYPGKGVTTSFSPNEAVKSCPWDSHGTGAWTFDRQEVDWICVNIFHLTESAIDTFYQEAYDAQKLWRDDDYYYILGLGKGDPMELTQINAYQTDGVYYHVSYTVYEMSAQDTTQKGRELAKYYMVLQKKTIDGKEYWTMLYHSSDVPYVFEPFDING